MCDSQDIGECIHRLLPRSILPDPSAAAERTTETAPALAF